MAESQARYERVNSIIKLGGVAGTSDEAVAEVLSNEVIDRLRTQYLDAVKREADRSKRYGSEHIAVINLQQEIKGCRFSLRSDPGFSSRFDPGGDVSRVAGCVSSG